MKTEFWAKLFDPTGFVPRAVCGEWTPELIRRHNWPYFLIWTAYLTIPVVLVSFAWRQRHELPYRHMFWLFGLFILSCGTTHLMDVVLFYNPVYRLAGLVKLITAAASWGTIVALIGIVPDALAARSTVELEREVTQHKQAQFEASRLAASIIEASDDSIMAQAPDGTILSWNKGAEKIYGFSAEEAIGQSIHLIVPPEGIVEAEDLLERVRSGERIQHYEAVRVRKDGQHIDIALTLSPLFDANGQVTLIAKVARDITQKKRADAQVKRLAAELAAANQANQRILDRSLDAICTVDSEGRFMQMSAACQKMWGYTSDEMIGLCAFDLVCPEDRDKTLGIAQRIIAGESVSEFENRSMRKDGSLVSLVWSAAWSEEDQAMYCVARDNTQRKQAEVQLRQTEGQLRAIMDHTPDMIYLKDQQFRFLMVNQHCASLFNLTPEEMVGKTDYDILPAELVAPIRAHDENVLHEGAVLRLEEEVVYKGEPHIYLSGKFPICDEEGRIYAMAGISTNITARKRTEEALRRNEHLYRSLSDAMPQIVYTAGPDGRLDYCNQRWFDYTGMTPEDSQNSDWNTVLHPDDFQRAVEQWTETVRTGSDLESEMRYRRAADGTYRWHLGRAVAVRDESGQIIKWFGTLTDIDDHKRAEQVLHDYTAKLEANNRELQDFTFVASHDLQEPLRKIQAFGDRLKTRNAAALDDTGRDYLERMQNAAVRMQKLIDDLLSLSRVTTQAQPVADVDLKQVVREVVSDLEVRLEKSGGQMQIGDLPSIEADASQMRQLFQNLIGNALKFHRPGVTPIVRVEAEFVVPDEDHHSKYCRITVEDNGIGFEEEYLDRIFAPFQRLHGRDEYEGTGIGLTICRKIAECHSGQISAQSTPGKGTTFIVTLPAKTVYNATKVL